MRRSFLETIIAVIALLIILGATSTACIRNIRNEFVYLPYSQDRSYVTSLAMVNSETLRATAFAINSDYLMTAGHFCTHVQERVEAGTDSSSLTLITTSPLGASGPTLGAQIAYIHPDEQENDGADMCILYSPSHGLLPLAISHRLADLRAGDVVTIVGSPKGVQYVKDFGTISSIEDEFMNINAMIHHGNSGSPVLWKGEVVGMVVMYSGGLRKIAIALHSDILNQFIENSPM